eukprot:5369753-Pyramimonas_sp.AAC.1
MYKGGGGRRVVGGRLQRQNESGALEARRCHVDGVQRRRAHDPQRCIEGPLRALRGHLEHAQDTDASR